MTMLEEWQHHIKGEEGLSLCGEKIGLDFALVDFQHAVGCITTGSRLLPCPACWAAVLAIAEKDPQRFKTPDSDPAYGGIMWGYVRNDGAKYGPDKPGLYEFPNPPPFKWPI